MAARPKSATWEGEEEGEEEGEFALERGWEGGRGGRTYLELEVGVEEEVLRLDVPMVDPTLVAEGEGVRELLEYGLGDALGGGKGGGRGGGRER